jgi:hypothetical protein
MQVYGADFSGARDSSKGIYYAEAELNDLQIIIKNVTHCDDRLDLFAAITNSNAPWGLDFPFALPCESYNLLGLESWQQLLELTHSLSREKFAPLINSKLGNYEACPSEKNYQCRYTDVAVKSFSPLKKFNPNMQAMIYGGFKLLHYLNKAGTCIYPFSKLTHSQTRVYEVYPSYLWAKVKMRRTLNLNNFIKAFNLKYPLKIEIPSKYHEAPNQDFADAIIASICMATCIKEHRIDQDWQQKPKNVSKDEWDTRFLEGLIIRV